MRRALLSRCASGSSRPTSTPNWVQLRSRLGKRGRVLRRNATRLVV
ncbi:MAG: hypothetical protein M3460_12435 [Actinomycetota bacterium]|nr:hypothetical protein [Actinomycetota bacterium]